MNIILEDVRTNGRGSINFELKNHKKSAFITIRIESEGETIEFMVDREALIKSVGALK